jgi:ADP-heptose:LPS heptosyltransferase
MPGARSGEAHWNAFPQNNELDAFANKVVLLPGAGKPNKLWPVERFRELARRIRGDALAVWGPGERELAEAIGAHVAPPTNLRELAWILQHARVVIGGDTGPLHLADALGANVIGLYGPTNPRRNGPYTQLDRCIDRFSSTKLMGSITVEEVMKILKRIGA